MRPEALFVGSSEAVREKEPRETGRILSSSPGCVQGPYTQLVPVLPILQGYRLHRTGAYPFVQRSRLPP